MKKGFTLIELLIVIAILGILSIGLMAALNPLEQLKRARDTANRNKVEEFYNAALRYYSVRQQFPWTTTLGPVGLDTMTSTYIQSLIDMGELKEGFKKETGLDRLFLTSTHTDFAGNADDISVCFVPESKAIQGEENSKYNQSGVIDTNCSASTCYWCAK